MRFADAPAAAEAEARKAATSQREARAIERPGLKKGFLNRPKPVLKNTSSITEIAQVSAAFHFTAIPDCNGLIHAEHRAH